MSDSAPNEVKTDPDDDRVGQAICADIPHLYCNGFTNVIANSDILIIIQHNGIDVATCNMSFTVAKTLGAALSQSISNLEQSTGREIMTSLDVKRLTDEDRQP